VYDEAAETPAVPGKVLRQELAFRRHLSGFPQQVPGKTLQRRSSTDNKGRLRYEA